MDPQVQALQLRHGLHLLGSAKNPHGVDHVQWKSMEKSWKITGNHGKSLENHRDFFKKNHWKITGTSMEKSIKINGQSMDNQ